jgi:hypothetical protein
MNVAREGDLRVKTSALKPGRLARDLQSLFPVTKILLRTTIAHSR